MHHQSVTRAALALSLVIGLGPVVVHAQSAPPGGVTASAQRIDIPAQPLAEALNEWARITRVQIIVQQGLVAGKMAPAVSGRLTAQQALDRLLQGSGLSAAIEDGAAVVQLAPTSTEAALLSTITTRGSRESAYGPAGGFVAHRSATSTKMDVALAETPQAVSVVTREQIQAQAADSVDQALQYTAGVSMFEGGSTRNVGARFVIRGFSTLGQSAMILNGSKLPSNSLSGSLEPYHYERIEVLKGPASIMYGQATPGGVINLVSKRPTAEPVREVEAQVGSWNRKQIAVDLGGAVTEDERVRYRLTALRRTGNTMVREYPNDRTSLAGSVEWQLTDSTLLTLMGTYDYTRAAFDAGRPQDGTLLPNPGGRISRTLFIGEEERERFSGKGNMLGYRLEHQFNDDWEFRQNVLAFNRKVDWAYTSMAARVNPATPHLGEREFIMRDDTDRGVSVDNQLHGTIRHGAIEHKLLLGLDVVRSRFERQQQFDLLPPLDLFSPVYGGPAIDDGGNQSTERSRHVGVYLQDFIKIGDHWIAVVGGRYDFARDDGGNGTTPEKAQAFTPRLGLMYRFDNGINPYYSYSRSFMPTAGMDFNGSRFKPTTGVQHEVGVKYEPDNSNVSVTMAAFHITQRNELTGDPDHVGYLLQTGKVRSRGLEIEARAELHRQLSVVAAFALIDAKILESNWGDEGARPTAVPRNMASIWADYKLDVIPGMSLGLGVRHVGKQEVNRMAVPGYTVSDAAIRYERDHWEIALNVKNLTDKNYIASCPSVCYYGDERNFLLTARYRW